MSICGAATLSSVQTICWLCYDQFDLNPCVPGWKCIHEVMRPEIAQDNMPEYYTALHKLICLRITQ